MPKAKKPKLWSSHKADTEFSLFIRRRDGKCVRCGNKNFLQNSHYWSRVHSSVRYDPENCDTLCAKHHFEWEYDKQGAYRLWKIEQLGEERYALLEHRKKQFKSRQDAIEECMQFLGVLK